MNAARIGSKEASPTPVPHSARRAGFVLAAVGCGMVFAGQGRVNGALGTQLGDGFLAAAISFGCGLVLLALLLPFHRRMRAGLRRIPDALRRRELRPWFLLGGIGGAAFVASQAITVGLIGVALFTVSVVAGQTVSGLLVDKVGLGPAGPQPLTVARVGGAVLTLGGVGLSLSGGIEASGGLALVIFPLVAGIALAVQQALNGRVAGSAGSAFAAGLLNFAVGTVALVLASVVAVFAVYGVPDGLPTNPVLYLGGPAGVLFIVSAAFLVGRLGVLVMSLCIIAGQLIGSVLVDLLLPAGGGQPDGSVLLGAGITLVAVAIATLPTRRTGSAKMSR